MLIKSKTYFDQFGKVLDMGFGQVLTSLPDHTGPDDLVTIYVRFEDMRSAPNRYLTVPVGKAP